MINTQYFIIFQTQSNKYHLVERLADFLFFVALFGLFFATSFIEVVDICCNNAILLNCALHSFEPLVDKYWVIAQCTFVIQVATKLRLQCFMLFYKIRNLNS